MSNILVVIDMQNDFTTGCLGNAECVAVIDKIDKLMENNRFDGIYFTRDTHDANYMNTQEGRKLPIEHCIKDTEGWQIVDSLWKKAEKTCDNVSIYDKPTFGSVKLARAIEDIYGDSEEVTVTFVGVCTGICVISNVAVLKAVCPEIDIRVIGECCACVTPESHKTALDAMKTFQVTIM